MDENQNLLSSELQIDNAGHGYLMETAKWGTFLGVLGFIMSGIILIAAIAVGVAFSKIENNYGYGSSYPMSPTAILIIYLVTAVINFFMSLFLYRFASKMKVALNTTDQEALNTAFANQKTLYRMIGIIAIIYLAILALALIFGIGSAFMR